MVTLAVGMIFGFLSACLLITATRDVPRMFNWFSGLAVGSRDPHHYSDLEPEVCSVFLLFIFYHTLTNIKFITLR